MKQETSFASRRVDCEKGEQRNVLVLDEESIHLVKCKGAEREEGA